MSKLRSATVFAVAVLAAAPALAQKPAGCATVLVTPRDGESNNADRFSAAATVDLVFTVLLEESLLGDHVVTVKVTTPAGHPFQSMTVPTTTDDGEARLRKVPGYPFPVEERIAHAVSHGNGRYLAVEIPFPVAGTPIVTSSLYGRWRVEAFIDGDRSPCSPPNFFRLEP